MYFENRAAAGQQLADKLAETYLGKPCTIVALSTGAVAVGLQIALRLNCPIAMLLTEEITLPQENTPIGGITHSGVFSYNHAYSDVELEEFVMEYHGVIEADKLEKLHRLHHQMAHEELISPTLLQNRNVILVSDGLQGGFILDLAISYLKPIKHLKLVVATPFADIYAVDRMHILADELLCINVLENYISTDHYYDDPASPTREEATAVITKILRHWNSSQQAADAIKLSQSQGTKRVGAHTMHNRLRPSVRVS
jgi:putative phosphoribosyl transferase